MIKTLCACALSLTFCAAFAGESSDVTLSSYPPVAWTLSRGALQVGTNYSYTDIKLGKALGADVGDNDDSVGEYSEKGGQVWFGLTDNDTVGFQFSLAEFQYGSKEAEVSFQELRYKRALIVQQDGIGFLSAEFAWRRHSVNELRIGGSSKEELSNTMHDYGWGGRLLFTRSVASWDLHAHL